MDDSPKSDFAGTDIVGIHLALENLLHIGNFPELRRQAHRFLEKDLENATAHYFLSLALIQERKFKEAWHHIEQVRADDPEATEGFHAAMIYHLERGKLKPAMAEAKAGLELEPDDALFTYFAGVISARQGRLKEATKYIARARELDPEDPDTINLDLQLRGVKESGADQAWDRIHEYEKALTLDPENTSLFEGMGDVYFDDLDDHENAERCYRQALLLDPVNARLQRLLFRAVAKRRLFYRFLSIPMRAWTWLGDVIRGLRFEPWRALLMLIFIKGWLIFLGWLMVITILFAPACRIYEWLIVSQMREASRQSDTHLRLWTRFHRQPLALRFSLFIMLNLGLWWAMMHSLGIPPGDGFTAFGIIALGHWLCTAALFGFRRLRSRSGRKKAECRREQAHSAARPG
jgi:tetratricopeptide (TPR) repeat protein